MRLQGKVAIVTGASSGIGHAIATAFAEQGAVVYAADIAEGKFGGPLGANLRTASLDVSREEPWRDLVARVEKEQGKLSILVNNAGIVGSYAAIETLTLQDYNHLIAINQTSVFLGMRGCIPLMKRSGGGSIINISSIFGIVGGRGVAAYHASKGAVTLMTKNAALDYAPAIRVNSIHPGVIATPLNVNQDKAITQRLIDMTPLARMGKPVEIANAALFLASDESSFVTGSELVVDGGYTAQ